MAYILSKAILESLLLAIFMETLVKNISYLQKCTIFCQYFSIYCNGIYLVNLTDYPIKYLDLSAGYNDLQAQEVILININFN